VGGALIGGVASNSWSGTLPGAVSSLATCEAFKSFPKKVLINSIAFAAIKLSIDHVFPNHQILSSTAAIIPTGAFGPASLGHTLLAAAAGIAGSIFFKQIGLATSIVAEGICVVALGGYIRDLPIKGIYTTPFTTFFSVGAIASVITTQYLYRSLDPLVHIGALMTPFLITHLCFYYRTNICYRETTKKLLWTAIPIYIAAFGYHLLQNPLQALKFNLLYTAAVFVADHYVYKINAKRYGVRSHNYIAVLEHQQRTRAANAL